MLQLSTASRAKAKDICRLSWVTRCRFLKNALVSKNALRSLRLIDFVNGPNRVCFVSLSAGWYRGFCLKTRRKVCFLLSRHSLIDWETAPWLKQDQLRDQLTFIVFEVTKATKDLDTGLAAMLAAKSAALLFDVVGLLRFTET